MKVCVITKVADPASGGNLATALGRVFLDPQAKGGSTSDPREELGKALGQPMLDLYVMVPVFTVGEMFVLNENDRDPMGRKPSKWDVAYEEFDTIEEAVERATQAANGE